MHSMAHSKTKTEDARESAYRQGASAKMLDQKWWKHYFLQDKNKAFVYEKLCISKLNIIKLELISTLINPKENKTGNNIQYVKILS